MLETLYLNGDDYFEAIIEAIEQARLQIDLEVYIYESGQIGQRIHHALIDAAKRAVDVRIIVDGAGINYDFTEIARSLRTSGVQVRIFRPLPWRLEQWKYSLTSVKGFVKFWRLLADINHRNHRKMLIIDQQSVWLGSMNISQSHLRQDAGGSGWRDTAVHVESDDLRAPIEAFELVWNRSRRQHRREIAISQLRSPFRFNYHAALRHFHLKQLLRRIDNANQCIWITNAYFAPDARLIKALEAAARRGVDVKLLLPQDSDVFFMPWVSAFFYQRLLDSAVRVFEYLPSMLHAKTLVIDGWASVGSSNLNRRSLTHDLEVDYHLQFTENIEKLKRSFENDLEQSRELTNQAVPEIKRWKRWLGGLFLLMFGYWL